jgi:hypothetical protein
MTCKREELGVSTHSCLWWQNMQHDEFAEEPINDWNFNCILDTPINSVEERFEQIKKTAHIFSSCTTQSQKLTEWNNAMI